MKKIFTIISLSFLPCVSLLAQNFGTAIKDKADSLWTQTPETFRTTYGSPEIYKWKTPLKRVLTYKCNDPKAKLFFFKHPIAKAGFNFKSKQLQGMRLIFAKPTAISNKETYLEYSSKLKEEIAGLGKVGTSKLRKRKSKGGYRYTYSWRSPEYFISLRCSYAIDSKKTFNPGRSKFSIFRRTPVVVTDKKAETTPDTAPEASKDSKIKSNDKGDRYLGVKMLKEESPNECLYASTKRIFDYYKTTPRGRSWEKIKKSLKLNVKSAKGLKRVFASVIGECRCDVKKLATTHIFDDFNSIMKFSRDYDRNAGEMKKNGINSFKVTSFRKLLEVMDEDVLVKTRSNPKEIENFKSKACKEIDAEKPVLWVVFLGVVKEKVKPLAPLGGYVRIIVGYNSKTNEVIYSDNWGKGHELKKMSWEKAWAITLTSLAVTVKK